MPNLRSEKPLSGGAKMVRPRLFFLSCPLICSAMSVFFSSRMNVVKWPDFLRIEMILMGPDGTAAAGDSAGA